MIIILIVLAILTYNISSSYFTYQTQIEKVKVESEYMQKYNTSLLTNNEQEIDILKEKLNRCGNMLGNAANEFKQNN